METVSVHTVLLPNGKVLFWENGSQNYVWDPATGISTNVAQPRTNLFCAGHVPLPDGRILATGGDFQALGTKQANIFDPVTQQWTAAGSMAAGRWYPTTTVLSDGRVLAVSGAETCRSCYAQIPEVYDYRNDTWTQLPSAIANIPMYPHLFVLADGRVLNAGASEFPTSTTILDVNAQTWSMVDSRILDGGSTTTYAPGKFLKAGSSAGDGPTGNSAATTYVLDMNQPSPAWRQTASMANPRSYLNLTTLPDGSVLTTGGDTTNRGVYTNSAVYEAEMWSPATETWTQMASASIPRLYHSTALLLPDARVLVSGGGFQIPAPNQESAEIYSPPYLFKGARPVITSAPSGTIPYGSSFFVGTPDGASIASVSLVRTGAVTHAFDQNARLVPATFSQTAGGLNVDAPANSNLAPPGDYMLFLLNSQGVPSVSKFVRFPAPDGTQPTPTSTPAGTATSTPTASPTSGAGSTSTPTSTRTNTPLPAATNTPTPTPPAGGTTTFGRTSSTGINDSSNSGYIEGSNFSLAQPGTLQSLSIYLGAVGGTNPRARLALYTDTGGQPGTRLGESAEIIPVAGWNTVPIPNGPALSAGSYWIVAQVNTKPTVFRYASGQPASSLLGWTPFAYGAFPATITTSWTRFAGAEYLLHGTVALP